MPRIDFRAVRSLVSMAEVLQLLGFEARLVRGNQLRGPCPLHGSAESSRVFSVNLAKNTFQCFKCGAAGNHRRDEEATLRSRVGPLPTTGPRRSLARHRTEKRNP
jgi:hypothetical protein